MLVKLTTMSSSSRPRTRNQLEQHFKNLHRELKRKRQCSSGDKKDPVIICENSSGYENLKKDESSMKRRANSGTNGGKKCFVSARNGRKGKEKNFSNMGSVDRVMRREAQLDLSASSEDDEDNDGIEFLGEKFHTNDSNLSASSEDNEENDGVECLGEKIVTNGSISSANSEEDEDNDGIEFLCEKIVKNCPNLSVSSEDGEEDDGVEFLFERIVPNGSGLKNMRDLESKSVSNVGNSYGNSNPVGVKQIPNFDGFVNLVFNTSDSENAGGGSDGSPDQSVDSNMHELESSSEEEDDSDAECKEDELLSSDDSSDVPYSLSDEDVEYVSDRDIGKNGEENKKNDIFVEKTLRSGKKIKTVNQKIEIDTEINKDNRSAKGFSGKSGSRKRKFPGIEIVVDIDEEQRTSKSQKKDPQFRKFTWPPPIIKRDKLGSSDDDESESLKRGCSSEKKGSSKEAVANLRTKTTHSAGNDESESFKQECSSEKKGSYKEVVVNLGTKTTCSARNDESESLKRECSRAKKGSSEEVKVNLGKKTNRSARDDDLIRILLNSMNEDNNNVEESGLIHEPLQLKFRFEDEVVDPPPEKSEGEKEIDSLFLEMELCLRASEMESANLSKIENAKKASKEVDECPEACCGRGEHQPITDEQIGIVCRFCGAIILEIKDILPPWYTPRSRRQDRKYFVESPNSVNCEFQFQDSVHGPNESFMRVEGTVWDLIPGFEKDMFPHQREGFEFLWKNIAGDIEIEKLPKTLSDDGRGCIISHAPGTGKTRLSIVFLLSFFKRYPNAHPVIIAPPVILSTWEKEFTKWKVDIPFHNLNSSELLGNETRFGGGTKKEGVRLAKMCSWVTSGGILAISYQLFGSLASKNEKGGGVEAIWNALVKKPSLLVLDEGHTPRNGKSLIWNAVNKVATKRCIILSGTPFQNNFEELKNTLCLVDPRFLKMGKSSWKELTEGKDELEKLRSVLDPYVHLHKGSVLQKSLPGLKEAIIFLRATELQKTLMNVAEKEKNCFRRTRLVSLISVHPSALMVDENAEFVKSRTFSSYKDKLEEVESILDEGVKIKFVMNLIQLADVLGERVLIFSPFIDPLIFIKEQLKTHFSWNEGREVLYMDGKIEEKNRQQSISSFNNGLSEAKVLLASEKACSEGINLVGASRVVLLHTVWNPSVEKQAISRAYRLGQKKVVYVYRLIISGMDVRQFELQARKDQISELIFSPVDGQAGESEASRVVLEDKVLEQMQSLESLRNTFEKIVHQPKESDFIESFRFADL